MCWRCWALMLVMHGWSAKEFETMQNQLAHGAVFLVLVVKFQGIVSPRWILLVGGTYFPSNSFTQSSFLRVELKLSISLTLVLSNIHTFAVSYIATFWPHDSPTKCIQNHPESTNIYQPILGVQSPCCLIRCGFQLLKWMYLLPCLGSSPQEALHDSIIPQRPQRRRGRLLQTWQVRGGTWATRPWSQDVEIPRWLEPTWFGGTIWYFLVDKLTPLSFRAKKWYEIVDKKTGFL